MHSFKQKENQHHSTPHQKSIPCSLHLELRLFNPVATTVVVQLPYTPLLSLSNIKNSNLSDNDMDTPEHYCAKVFLKKDNIFSISSALIESLSFAY